MGTRQRPIEPGKRILQLAIREAISSKLSLNSEFKREFDRKKHRIRKSKDERKISKENLVSKEMADIYRKTQLERKENQNVNDKEKISHVRKCFESTRKTSFKYDEPPITDEDEYLNSSTNLELKELEEKSKMASIHESPVKCQDPSFFNNVPNSPQRNKICNPILNDTWNIPEFGGNDIEYNILKCEEDNKEIVIPPPYYPPCLQINSQFLTKCDESHIHDSKTLFNSLNTTQTSGFLHTSNNSFNFQQHIFLPFENHSPIKSKIKSPSNKRNSNDNYIEDLIDSFINTNNEQSKLNPPFECQDSVTSFMSELKINSTEICENTTNAVDSSSLNIISSSVLCEVLKLHNIIAEQSKISTSLN